ncbi:Zn-dependent protease with chaperone function [Idiomarina sp. A28L]|uniref:M48 family metallopeptidase n=1 Tax=Idiomarina sp. A28L TaxID=1036674 RepID=UPI0002138C1D|nr:M48 family metallopeptidase [Idiomarina sp. A28L]EGN75415.1 Zn-dependent protease with chaperone function [Idiomarina sp. A28L]
MSAMNFFEHQAIARRNTRLLVVLFGLAVISLLLLTGLLVAAFTGGMSAMDEESAGGGQFLFHWDIIVAVMGMTLSAISLAVLFKWYMLKGGGKVVAESLGGRRLSPDSNDATERKVLNVVEEMAIAANMPVPPVYLMEQEQGINAFAAGYSPRDAVIGVTRGCVENLTRDQLQGVIAHEIAHILNGDMRMNIRIIAILNGILFISHAGYLLLRTGMYSRRNDKNPLPFIGIGLLVIGALGVLFGNIIKAAVSRQREYLADASAVQFTRNPEGIGGALEQIGALSSDKGSGSKVESKNADEASHLFFGQAISKAVSLFATHPPLAKRIKRVRPNWDGKFRSNPKKQLAEELAAESKLSEKERMAQRMAVLGSTAGALGGGIGGGVAASLPEGMIPGDYADAGQNFTQGVVAATIIDEAMRTEVRQQAGAQALVFAMALSADNEVRNNQFKIIASEHDRELQQRSEKDYQQISELPLEQRLPLIELSVPALKSLDKDEAYKALATLDKLVAADNQVSLYEWCLVQMLQRYVRAEFEPNKRVAKVGIRKQSDAEFTLSVLAWYGHESDSAAEAAFAAGAQGFSKNLKPYRQQPFNFAELSDCLDRIDQWSVQEKEQMVNAWLTCAKNDGEINVVERKLLTTLSACIGEPLPHESEPQ